VPEARCILHLHPPYATALATLADPKSSEESLYARVGVLLGLKSVVHSEVDLIERLEKGLGVAAVQSLRTRIGLTDAETFELIAPRRTLSRREASGQLLSREEADKTVRVARVGAWNKLGGRNKRLQQFCARLASRCAPLRTLTLSRIGQDGTNMLAREAREVLKDFILGHPTGEVFEDIGWRNAGSGKRRLGAAHTGDDLNELLPVHDEVR